MPDLRKVNPGDPLSIPAGTYNTFIDVAKQYLAHRIGQFAGGGDPSPSTDMVLVRNDSGADRDRFDILGLDDIVFDDDIDAQADGQVFSGVEPTTDHIGRFAIVLEPVADGEIATACIVGLCVARITLTAASDQYADVTSGDATQLTSGTSGAAQILWKSVTTAGATGWAVVRLGNPAAQPIMRGKPTAPFSSGATITLQPCDIRGTANGLDNVTAYVQASKASYAMYTGTTLPTTAVVEYAVGDDGNCYLVGTPRVALVDVTYDLTLHKLQKTFRNDWGGFYGTTSALVDIDAPVPCSGAT